MWLWLLEVFNQVAIQQYNVKYGRTSEMTTSSSGSILTSIHEVDEYTRLDVSLSGDVTYAYVETNSVIIQSKMYMVKVCLFQIY